MKYLLCLDLDGTLLITNQAIHQSRAETKDAEFYRGLTNNYDPKLAVPVPKSSSPPSRRQESGAFAVKADAWLLQPERYARFFQEIWKRLHYIQVLVISNGSWTPKNIGIILDMTYKTYTNLPTEDGLFSRIAKYWSAVDPKELGDQAAHPRALSSFTRRAEDDDTMTQLGKGPAIKEFMKFHGRDFLIRTGGHSPYWNYILVDDDPVNLQSVDFPNIALDSTDPNLFHFLEFYLRFGTQTDWSDPNATNAVPYRGRGRSRGRIVFN